MTQSLSDPRRHLVVGISCLAVMLLWANTAALITALPSIGTALRADQLQLQWAGNVYPLAIATLLLPCGVLLDRFGRKRGMVIGLLLLLCAEAFCGYASSPLMLVVARGLCGVGAALVYPATLATLSAVLRGREQQRAVSFWAVSSLFGALIGALCAALLINVAWWGATYELFAGLTLVTLILTLMIVPETHQPAASRFDPLGFLLAVVAAGGLVFAITQGPVSGWGSTTVIAPLFAGIVAAAGFVAWELRTASPLFDLKVFRDRTVASSSIAIVVIFVTNFGFALLIFQYCGYVWGYSALRTSLLLVPGGLAALPGALVGPWIVQRFGLRVQLAGSLLMGAVGMVIFVVAAPSRHPIGLEIALMFLWVGLGLTMTPATQVLIKALPDADQGVASAFNDVLREFGAAVGIALLGSTFNAGYRYSITHHLGGSLTPLPASEVKNSPAQAAHALNAIGAQGSREFDILRNGVIAGWRVALSLAAVLMVLGAIAIMVSLTKHVSIKERSVPDELARTGGQS